MLSEWRSSKQYIVATICLAMFTDGFVFGVVVPVYPFLLQANKIASANKVQLYTSILTAAFPITDLITAPICAFYVDHYHNRRVTWFIGLVGIVVGNLLFGAGDSFSLLLASRLLQGAASAILYTVGLAVLVESVNKDGVGTYMGLAMSCNNFGIIMSPLLGGVMYQTKGKMAVFGIMGGLIGVDITARLLMIESRPQSRDARRRLQDVQASLAEKIPIISVYEADEISLSTTSSSSIDSQHELLEQVEIGMKAEQLDPLSISISRDPATQKPFGASRFRGVLRLIRSPRLLAALYGCFINECIVASLCAVLPLFVERTFHWTSLQAGCLFLTIAIPGLAGSLAGMLADKVGARWVSVAGFALTTPSLIAMMAVKSDGTAQAILLCALLTLAGSTIILFLSPLGADLSLVADELSEELGMDLYASSFSLMNTALATAGVVGPLFVGWLQDQVGWTGTCVALGMLCFSGVVPCALFTGSKLAEKDDAQTRA